MVSWLKDSSCDRMVVWKCWQKKMFKPNQPSLDLWITNPAIVFTTLDGFMTCLYSQLWFGEHRTCHIRCRPADHPQPLLGVDWCERVVPHQGRHAAGQTILHLPEHCPARLSGGDNPWHRQHTGWSKRIGTREWSMRFGRLHNVVCST